MFLASYLGKLPNKLVAKRQKWALTEFFLLKINDQPHPLLKHISRNSPYSRLKTLATEFTCLGACQLSTIWYIFFFIRSLSDFSLKGSRPEASFWFIRHFCEWMDKGGIVCNWFYYSEAVDNSVDLITILRFLTRKKIWQTFEFDTDQLLIFWRTTFAKINGRIKFPSIKVLRFFGWVHLIF